MVLLSVEVGRSSSTFPSWIRWFSTTLPFPKTARTLSEIIAWMVCFARDPVLLVSTKCKWNAGFSLARPRPMLTEPSFGVLKPRFGNLSSPLFPILLCHFSAVDSACVHLRIDNIGLDQCLGCCFQSGNGLDELLVPWFWSSSETPLVSLLCWAFTLAKAALQCLGVLVHALFYWLECGDEKNNLPIWFPMVLLISSISVNQFMKVTTICCCFRAFEHTPKQGFGSA